MSEETANAAPQPSPRDQAKELLNRLMETYPTAFIPFSERMVKPLKIGIHKDLKPVIKEWGYDSASLRIALSVYTRALRYQYALLKEPHRIDLQGEPAGDISEENRQTAREKIKLIQEKRRQNQPERKTRPPRHQKQPKTVAKGADPKALAALQAKFNN